MQGDLQPAYEFGAFCLDVAEQRLLCAGRPLPLTPKVFDVLRVLVQNHGHLVEKERRRILGGEKLSPILLVRDVALGKVLVADGYHRLCAIYSLDEETTIPCKIVSA